MGTGEDALDMIVLWIKQNGMKMPEKSDYGVETGKVGIPYARVFGLGEYKEGGNNYNSRIFSSVEEATAAIQQRLQKESLEIKK